ncbi:LOW QUALITY PROTEIN: hypothetical protein YC2023_009773 [Brassica napus]
MEKTSFGEIADRINPELNAYVLTSEPHVQYANVYIYDVSECVVFVAFDGSVANMTNLKGRTTNGNIPKQYNFASVRLFTKYEHCLLECNLQTEPTVLKTQMRDPSQNGSGNNPGDGMPGAGTLTTKPSLGVSKATPEASVGMDMHPGLLKEARSSHVISTSRISREGPGGHRGFRSRVRIGGETASRPLAHHPVVMRTYLWHTKQITNTFKNSDIQSVSRPTNINIDQIPKAPVMIPRPFHHDGLVVLCGATAILRRDGQTVPLPGNHLLLPLDDLHEHKLASDWMFRSDKSIGFQPPRLPSTTEMRGRRIREIRSNTSPFFMSQEIYGEPNRSYVVTSLLSLTQTNGSIHVAYDKYT